MDLRGNHMFTDISEIKTIVQGFEACTTAKDSFTHRDHLTVAVWYLHGRTEDEALELMRAGLLRFLTHHGVGTAVYNETITRFWIRVVKDFIRGLDPNLALAEIATAVTKEFTNSRLLFEYYSEALVKSDAAKLDWVEPDLRKF